MDKDHKLAERMVVLVNIPSKLEEKVLAKNWDKKWMIPKNKKMDESGPDDSPRPSDLKFKDLKLGVYQLN